jgi:hypothetical protein
MNTAEVANLRIETLECKGDKGLRALQSVFGGASLERRALIMACAKLLSPSATHEGSWRAYQLSNGGFFMTPPAPLRIEIPAAGVDLHLCTEAAGVVCSLYAYERLAEQSGGARFVVLRERLMAYARQRPDRTAILECLCQRDGQ